MPGTVSEAPTVSLSCVYCSCETVWLQCADYRYGSREQLLGKR